MKRELVFLITSFSRGGAEAQLIRLASQLSDRGWGIRIISMLNTAPVPEALAERKIEVVYLGMKRGAMTARALVRVVALLKKWRAPVLATFNYPANMLGRVAGRMAAVPVIISSIRNEHFGGKMRERLMRLTGALDAVTTTNSRVAARRLVSRNVVAAQRIRVIANGISVEGYCRPESDRLRVRTELEIGEDVFLWLAIGRLEPQKDYPTLFSAMELVNPGKPSTLCVAGNGSLETELRKDIARRKLDERVRLLGLRDDIPSLLGACDAFVLSSAWEGLPNVIMEALAAAKPAVSTVAGGAEELVTDGVSGFLVPPRNPRELARAMDKLMDLSANERDSMGCAGREKMKENFGVERVVDAWEALFVEQITARAPTFV